MWQTAVSRKWTVFPLLLLAVTLPFELDRPLFNVGPIAITNVELVLGFVFLTSLCVAIQYKEYPRLPRTLWIWALLFIISLLLSTLFAPTNQFNALKASLRLMMGLALAMLAIPVLVQTWQSVRWVAWTLLFAGGIAGFIGWVEYAQNRELVWLNIFRTQPTLAGGLIRLTGPFDYANQTAMFIEATFPILVCTIWYVWQKQWRWQQKTAVILPLILCTILYLQASILTFSRSSIVTIAFVSLLVAGSLIHKKVHAKNQFAYVWFTITGIIVFLIVLNGQFNDLFRLRLQTEGDNEWYSAALTLTPITQMARNEMRTIPITLTNNGSLTWRSSGNSPINLGARWIRTSDQQTISEPRWPFVTPVPPGEQVEMKVALQAPAQPGNYELVWDVVHERITWFGAKTSQHVIHRVQIVDNEQSTLTTAPEEASPWQYSLPIPDRRTLWLTAFMMWQKRPFFGIGADNFRLTYGGMLGATSWNETIHTNNWGIETAVSLGIVGTVIVAIAILTLAIDILRRFRQDKVLLWQIALGAGIIAYLIHGLLDFFLLFNATGLLFWMLIGLWITTRTNLVTNEKQHLSLHE